MNDDRTGPTVSEIKPFHQVLNLAGNSHMDMQAWGIMLIPEEDLLPNTPYPQGLYLLVGAYGGSSSGTSTTTWNPYPYNPKWQPESLLCNSWSAATCHKGPEEDCGGMWGPGDCPKDISSDGAAAAMVSHRRRKRRRRLQQQQQLEGGREYKEVEEEEELVEPLRHPGPDFSALLELW